MTITSTSTHTSTTAPVPMNDREIHARIKLAEAVRFELVCNPHPHTESMLLDVLQIAAAEGWSSAVTHLRVCTSTHLVITAQTAARLLHQYEAQRSDTD